MTHDAVLEAAVVGHPDENELIKPKAFVVLKPGLVADADLSKGLQDHVKSRLAPFKYPRWIEFVGELPKTATGKIQRFKLSDNPRRIVLAQMTIRRPAATMQRQEHNSKHRRTAP